MKPLLYILVYLFSGFVANAQITTFQLSLKDSTKNILYIGVPNRVYIKNLPPNTSVSLSNGAVRQDGNSSKYILTIDKVEKSVLFVKKNGKIIFRKTFEVSSICDPYLQLGMILDFAKATPAQILTDPRLIVGDTCALRSPFRVVSFSVLPSVKNELGKSEDVIGDLIPASVLAQIKNMHHGDKIYFDDIKVVCLDSRARSLPSFVVSIR